jgi:hypothetical protein
LNERVRRGTIVETSTAAIVLVNPSLATPLLIKQTSGGTKVGKEINSES